MNAVSCQHPHKKILNKTNTYRFGAACDGTSRFVCNSMEDKLIFLQHRSEKPHVIWEILLYTTNSQMDVTGSCINIYSAYFAVTWHQQDCTGYQLSNGIRNIKKIPPSELSASKLIHRSCKIMQCTLIKTENSLHPTFIKRYMNQPFLLPVWVCSLFTSHQ